jgi:hypothetical protein
MLRLGCTVVGQDSFDGMVRRGEQFSALFASALSLVQVGESAVFV